MRTIARAVAVALAWLAILPITLFIGLLVALITPALYAGERLLRFIYDDHPREDDDAGPEA